MGQEKASRTSRSYDLIPNRLSKRETLWSAMPETIRIPALPAPGIDAHGIDVSFRAPVKEFGSESRGGIAGGNVARAARR